MWLLERIETSAHDRRDVREFKRLGATEPDAIATAATPTATTQSPWYYSHYRCCCCVCACATVRRVEEYPSKRDPKCACLLASFARQRACSRLINVIASRVRAFTCIFSSRQDRKATHTRTRIHALGRNSTHRCKLQVSELIACKSARRHTNPIHHQCAIFVILSRHNHTHTHSENAGRRHIQNNLTLKTRAYLFVIASLTDSYRLPAKTRSHTQTLNERPTDRPTEQQAA